MVGVVAAGSAKSIIITGHGFTIPARFELLPGVYVDPKVPDLNHEAVASSCESIRDQAAIITMHEIATFALEVEHAEGGKPLATKAWNRLWDFHLLSLASASPCFMLYSVSFGKKPAYAVVNRNLIINPFDELTPITLSQLGWAKHHLSKFEQLVKDQRFSSAMRYYGNSHYLFDFDARIMLLWAGIEGLLDVDAELSRRLALYAAVMFDGTPQEKADYFDAVRKSYGVRSRVVHGSKPPAEKLKEGYDQASRILVRLLAKCVELGRVPTPAELDRLAVSQTIS
jgi:hypothetical protein